jgi:pimeloyl-ACP methyl ester carboxylesterase
MRRLRIGDRLLRVRDEGEPPRGARRPPLVCIHGAGASSVVWMDTVRRLAPRRRVVAIDLPGHGQSDLWHPPSDVTIAMYADAVGTVCRALGIERAVLVGHSMGGQIALDAAARWPERVAGVFVVASAGAIAVGAGLLATLAEDPARFPEKLRPLLWSPSTPRDLVDRWTGLLSSAEAAITRADLVAVGAYDGLKAAARLRAPLFALAGADDLMVPPASVRDLVGVVRGAQADLAIVPRAGHLPMIEQPDAYFSALDAFLTVI